MSDDANEPTSANLPTSSKTVALRSVSQNPRDKEEKRERENFIPDIVEINVPS